MIIGWTIECVWNDVMYAIYVHNFEDFMHIVMQCPFLHYKRETKCTKISETYQVVFVLSILYCMLLIFFLETPVTDPDEVAYIRRGMGYRKWQQLEA